MVLKDEPTPPLRQSDRVEINAEVVLRRAGQIRYRVCLYDLSPEGCKVEFVDRPRLAECVWVKISGLQPLEAVVRWIEGAAAGLEFRKPIHPAVYQSMLDRLQR